MAPIYLVSACSSGEEFVSAFRRYADRNGVLFVPIATPLPPGKKGRFALTLADGGVMVEGEAEVVSSAKTPSVLYGRVGMTLKFTEPDDPSKTILGDLEKARLTMKPGAPSAQPRPAEVPAQPRATVPATGGRIDASNAPAECVAIGDVSALAGGEPPKPAIPAGKFAVPSIPPVAGARPKSPSTPTPPVLRAVALPTTGPLAKPPTGPSPIVPANKETVMGMQAVERAPSGPIKLPVEAKETTMGMLAIERAPSGPIQTPGPPTQKTPVPTGTVVGTPPAARTPSGGSPRAATPPVGAPVTQTPTQIGPPPARPATPPAGAGVVGRETTMGLQAIERTPSGAIRVPAQSNVGKETTMGMPVIDRAPASGPTRDDPTMPTPAKAAAAAAAARDKADLLQTVRGPAPGVDLIKPDKIDLNQTMRGPAPPRPAGTAPPPVADELVAVPQFDDTMNEVEDVDDADEPTDLTTIPIEPMSAEKSGREPRRTVIGVAVVPSGVHVLPAAPAMRPPTEEESRDTSVMEAQDDPSGPAMITSKPPVEVDAAGATMPAQRIAASANAGANVEGPNVEESTPSGDWTMTVGESGPTITPTPRGDKPVAKRPPPGPPTGDWSIALDPSRPDGWSEPSKIEKRPEGLPAGPPVSTVASEKDLVVKAPTMPAIDDGAKVEIDPTLMEPLQPLQPIDDFEDEPNEPHLPPPPSAAYPAVAAPLGMDVTQVPQQVPIMPMPVTYTTPLPGQLPNASGQVPAYPMESHLQTEAVRVPRAPAGDAERKRRILVIAISAGVALALVIVLAIVLGGGKKSSDAPAPGPASAAPSVPSSAPPAAVKQPPPPPPKTDGGSAQQAAALPAVPPDAAVEQAAPDAAAPIAASGDCTVSLVSAPAGAEIVLDKDVIGTTPATVKLPCGVASTLTLRKQRYVSAQREVTATADGGKPVRVALGKVMLTVKVSSTPPGATILLGAKSLGVTPAVIKLPAFEPSTIKIQKDGYAPDLQKLTPKTNNTSVSSTLKKLVVPKRR